MRKSGLCSVCVFLAVVLAKMGVGILFVCLSVRPCKVWGGLGNDLIAASGTYGCFELAGLFASSLPKRCHYYRQ